MAAVTRSHPARKEVKAQMSLMEIDALKQKRHVIRPVGRKQMGAEAERWRLRAVPVTLPI